MTVSVNPPAVPRLNTKTGVLRGDGHWALRIWASKPTRRKMARLLVKCGCCDEAVTLYHSVNTAPEILEINGVCASVQNWREVLLPVLLPQPVQKVRKK